MATRKQKVAPPQRDDWQEVGPDTLTDGRRATRWINLRTSETTVTLEGRHPFDQMPVAAVPALMSGSNEVEEIDDDEEEETAADRVAVMLSKGKGKSQAKVIIKRYQPDGSLAWCDEMPPEQFEQSGYKGISARFGAGKYQIYLYAQNPAMNNRFSCYGRETIEVMASNKIEEEIAPSTIAAAMKEAIAPLVARIEAAERRPDPQAEMQKTFALVAQMREAFGLNAQPQAPVQKSATETLREMLEIMDGVKTLREAAEPAPEPDTSLAGVGMKALEVIGAMMQGQAGGAQAAQSTSPLPTIAIPQTMAESPTMLPSNPAMTQSAAPQETATPEQAAFIEAVSMLNTMARFNASPETAAALIYEKAPDEVIDALQDAEWFTKLAQIAPSVRQFEPWYRSVHKVLMAELATDEAEESGGNEKTGTD